MIPVFDQMTAGALNDSWGNGISLIKITIVLEIGAIGEQVICTGIYKSSQDLAPEAAPEAYRLRLRP
jgi:hypothetical protein